MPGRKTVCHFSIILFLKGIMTFKVKESMHFVEKNINFNMETLKLLIHKI